MATIESRFFSGNVPLTYTREMPRKEFEARFPGLKGVGYDWYSRVVGFPEGKREDSDMLPADRKIAYKLRPSKHQCDARCMGGKVNGTCECQCGGKNHGLGNVVSSLVAA